MSRPASSPPPPDPEPSRSRSRFWTRWGIAAVVLGVLTVYGAFLEGGPSPGQEAPQPEATVAGADQDPAGERTPRDASAVSDATFERQRYAGSGSDRIELEVPGDQPAIMTVTHGGTASFVVEARDAAGATDLVVDTIGGYAGTRTVNLGRHVDGHRALAIQADGNWTIELLPLSDATRVEHGVASGRGDDVVLIDGGGHGWFSHDGGTEVVVEEYRGPALSAGSIIVDAVGSYDSDVQITEDAEVLAITADGAWELSLD